MEIKEEDININSNINIDPKKEKIRKSINDITELIDKFKDSEKLDENEIINEIMTYINQNNLDCFEILDRGKSTLLHSYCEQQKYFHLKIYLLTIEKILNDKNKLNEYLLLEDSTKINIFESASELGDIEIFRIFSKYLENNDQILNSLIKKEKNNIFHISARENKILSLLFYYEFYNDNPSVLNSKNRSQWTPLIMACYKGNYEYANILINLGADYSIAEKDGKNALFYAVESNNYRLIKYLILIGIDKNKKDNNNKKAIEYTKDKNIHDLLDNKNLFQTLFKCEIEYKSLKGHKTHIFYLILLLFLILIQTLIIILINASDKADECFHDFDSINFTAELIIFIICIFSEIFGILYYYIFQYKFNKYSNPINIGNKHNKLYELYLTNPNICAKCKKIMNKNTRHCIACDKCIENWDHHCFYLNACINNKNIKYFKFFMIQLGLIIIFNMILSVFLFMDMILYPKIYYKIISSCVENQNNFDFISTLLLIIFIIYFIISIYMLYGALLPFFIEFLCSSNDNNDINVDNETNESKGLLSISDE